MPATETVSANGVDFACLRRGDGDRLVLCLHGFPDDAQSLLPVAERLADDGYTAVLPYMRGYGPTGPAPRNDYDARTLGNDALMLASALRADEGYDEAYLIGHDWGAVAAYAAARIEPGAFDRIATLAVPPRFAQIIFRHPQQFLRSWYVWFFQLPVVSEHYLQASDFSLIEILWNLWSPGWDYDRAHLEGVKETFRSRGTVKASLQYYRQFVRPMAMSVLRDGPQDPDTVPDIETPALVLAGERDGCIGPELFRTTEAAFADDVACRVARINGAGHFMHRERPDVVTDEIRSFFADA
jgi:pimeloyl-ACP methyl ester carboxylesterase